MGPGPGDADFGPGLVKNLVIQTWNHGSWFNVLVIQAWVLVLVKVLMMLTWTLVLVGGLYIQIWVQISVKVPIIHACFWPSWL